MVPCREVSKIARTKFEIMSALRVLMYHKVSEKEQDFLTVTTGQLSEQLHWLKSRFHFITLRELVNHITLSTPLPKNALLVTFDDGYENNFTHAYPIFKMLNIPFSIFLVANFIGKNVQHDGKIQTFLKPEELQKMQDLVQFGYHGCSHASLMDIKENEWANEIKKGIDLLNALAITLENAWAYTYGNYPKKNELQFKKLKEIYHSNKIQCAFRIGNRINYLPLKEYYQIQRIDVRGNESFFKFKWKVSIGKLF